MNMSGTRRTALHAAIADPIMNLRVKSSRADTVGRSPMTPREIDAALYPLEGDIWKGVRSALTLERER